MERSRSISPKTTILILWTAAAGTLAGAAHADGTSCAMPPREGGFPAHVREAIRDLHAYQPENPAGWVARAREVHEHRRLVLEGLLREEDVPEHARAVSGEFWLPVLPTFFANSGNLPWDRQTMDQQLFSTQQGSMRDYYDEVSYGWLEVRGNVFDWQGVPENDTEYEGTNNGLGAQFVDFLEDAFEAHDPGVDFGLFDNDGPDGLPNSGDDDGVVDVVVLIHPEGGAECGGSSSTNIWSHHTYYSGYTGNGWETNDARWGGGSIYIDRYFVAPGSSCGGGPIEIGVYCHELGHALGIKDLYDTDDLLTGDSRGLGHWALMAGGGWNSVTSPAHMSAFSKSRLGWLNVLNLVASEDRLCLPPVETNPVAIRLWQYGAVTSEYFLVENRQRIGYDANLWGEGLVVYHVDEDRYDALAGVNDVNADETRKAVDLECADAMFSGNVMDADDLDAEINSGDANDVFCDEGGQDDFSPFTTPNSHSNSGVPTGVTIWNSGSCNQPDDFVCATFNTGVPVAVDVCMNDCAGDNCNEIATCTDWWGSPDIFVDNDGDGDHDIPAWGVENRLFTRVHNTGSNSAVATLGSVYLAWSAMGLVWPDDATELIGYTGFPVLESGETAIDDVTFEYPGLLNQNGHYCIGVVLQQTEDQPLSPWTQYTNNITQINQQVLFDRGVGRPFGRGATDCGPVSFETWVRILDGPNEGQNSVACEIRIGTHPNYDDVVMPSGWNFQIDPTTGPFIVSPTESDSVLVTIWSPSAAQGEMAHLPLTLWNLDAGVVMGGLVIDAHADCAAPGIVENLSADWIPPHGDDPDGPNVLVEWDHTTVDVNGNEELIQYYEVYRSQDGGIFGLAGRVAIDADPSTPKFQWTDHVASAGCPSSSWAYRVFAIDHTGTAGEGSVPFTLLCDGVVGVEEASATVVSRLLAAEPNPLQFATALVFQTDREGRVEVSLYNAHGQLVRRLLDEPRTAGMHRVHWDGRGDDGTRLPSGIYFARAVLPGGVVDTKKLTVMR